VHGGNVASTIDCEHEHGQFEIDSEDEDTAAEEESGEGDVLGTMVRAQAGLVPAILDTGAFSLWTRRAEFDKAGGKNFITLSTTARSKDGSPLKVEFEGMIQFQLWGRVVSENVRIMKTMAGRVIIGRKIMRQNNVVPDVGSG
jgi:hypothetical protein